MSLLASKLAEEVAQKWGEIAAARNPDIRTIYLPRPIFDDPQFANIGGGPIRFAPEDDDHPCRFQPHARGSGAQRGFFQDFSAKYCGYASGVRGGKSWAGSRKLAIIHLLNAFRDRKPTGVCGLMTSATYQTARTFNIPQVEQAFSELGIAKRFIGDNTIYALHIPSLDAPGRPSLIFFRSAEKPLSIVGFEVGHIWGDEVATWYASSDDPTLDAVVQSDQRMSDKRAHCVQFMQTSTHQGDDTTFAQRFERDKNPDHKLYRGRTSDNADNLVAGYEARLRGSLPEGSAEQYLEGGVMSLAGGLMYNQYLPELHQIDCAQFDQRNPVLMSMDFNKNPGSHAHLSQMVNGKIYVRHEFFEPRADARRLANLAADWMIREFEKFPQTSEKKWRFPAELQFFGDASGNTEGLADSAACWEEVGAAMANAGIPFTMINIPSANPHVADRVIAVNAALKAADGTTRLYIDKSCERLDADFRLLRWDGNKIDKRDKDRSHAADSAGYCVIQLLPVFDRR